jgi:pimeloyl-ACP methyl ester carboxylesterase
MDKSKKTILFLHGALGTSKDLAVLMGLMNEKNFNTLTFDFSGHGPTAKWPEEFRIDLFARELEKYIKDHKLTDLVVFGYSMGGYIGLYHVANYPDSPIKQLVTYGTKFNWSDKAVSRELPMLDPDHLKEKFPSFAVSLQEKHGDRWKALLRSTAHMMQNLERLDGLTREDLNDVDIPATFILGDQDRMVGSEETHLTASWLHHGHVKTLTHSKHELERSNLRELSDIIAEAIE